MSFSATDRQIILDTARASIHYGLQHEHAKPPSPENYPAPLQVVQTSFVTLHLSNQLRGCMGGLQATVPLICDVAGHAHMAAFKDPRFKPLNDEEFAQIHLHVSVLSAPEPMTFDNEADLAGRLDAHQDGLIIVAAGKRATFLPTVWKLFPDGKQFLERLKSKAGLTPEQTVEKAWRYSTTSIE